MSLIKKIMMSAVVLGLMGFGSEVWADKAGQVVSTLSFGGYQETDGEDTVSGSQLALGITVSVSDRWAVFSRLSDGSATGQRTISGNTYTLKSRMTTLSGGMQWSYPVDLNVDGDAELVPYVGAGVSLQHYQHDFAYPDSKVGSTSGNGVGPLFLLGSTINLARHFILIPGYHYQQISIKTESGDRREVVSSGVSLAFVARF